MAEKLTRWIRGLPIALIKLIKSVEDKFISQKKNISKSSLSLYKGNSRTIKKQSSTCNMYIEHIEQIKTPLSWHLD